MKPFRIRRVPSLPGISSIFSKLPKHGMPGPLKNFRVPALSRITSLPVVNRLVTKLSNIPLVSSIPAKVMIPVAGLVVIAAIGAMIFPSLFSSGGAPASEEEIVPFEEISATAANTSAPNLSTTTEPTEPIDQASLETISDSSSPSPTTSLEAIDPYSITILTENTTWSPDHGEYLLTDTLQVPSGITLTIEPGVTVLKPGKGDMFLINGRIVAHGTKDDRIVFDGGGNSNFFSPRNSDTSAFLDLSYCEIRNGLSLWPQTGFQQFGSFNIRHSAIHDISVPSFVWYPETDVIIEGNEFMNAAGFSIVQRHTSKVYIQYNTFQGKHLELSDDQDFWIENQGSFNNAETIVRYNTFTPEDGIVLKLSPGRDAASITAEENFWGTKDKATIDMMIYDKKDDPACFGYVKYEPILDRPKTLPETEGGAASVSPEVEE